VIIHGFFTPVQAAPAFGQTMGFPAFEGQPVALLSFPMAPPPAGVPTLLGAISLSTPVTSAHTKDQSTPSALHLTQ